MAKTRDFTKVPPPRSSSYGQSQSRDKGHDEYVNHTNRLLIFRGDDYSYWKLRMTAFLKSSKIWTTVKDPCIIDDKSAETLIESNDKAMNILFCALSRDELHCVCHYTTAHEIWKSLESTYEGETQIKTTKLRNLDLKFELFKMHDDEDIASMFNRLKDITNA